MSYLRWKKSLNRSIEIYPIELTGRGTRHQEPFYNSLDESVEDIFTHMKKYLDDSPYALFGHSMGSYLAFELYYTLHSMGYKEPIHLFFSGKQSPQNNKKDKLIHMLPNEEFINEIYGLGGTPKDLFQDEKSAQYFLSIMRADYRIVENYSYHFKTSKINCDVSVLSGKKDYEITSEDLLSWKEHTLKDFNIHMFDGGHFFIWEETDKITTLINKVLTSY